MRTILFLILISFTMSQKINVNLHKLGIHKDSIADVRIFFANDTVNMLKIITKTYIYELKNVLGNNNYIITKTIIKRRYTR